MVYLFVGNKGDWTKEDQYKDSEAMIEFFLLNWVVGIDYHVLLYFCICLMNQLLKWCKYVDSFCFPRIWLLVQS